MAPFFAAINKWYQHLKNHRTQANLAIRHRHVAMMQTAGVPILAGTDEPNPFCLTGFGLHDELQLLADSQQRLIGFCQFTFTLRLRFADFFARLSE